MLEWMDKKAYKASPNVYFYVQIYKSKSNCATIRLRLCADINGKSTHLAVLGALSFNPVLQDFSRRSLLDFFSTSNAAIHALKKKRWEEMSLDDETFCRLVQEKVVEQREKMRREAVEARRKET